MAQITIEVPLTNLSLDKGSGAAGQDDWYTWQTTQAGDWIGQWVGDNTADGNLDDLYVSIWDESAGALTTYDLSAGKTGGAAGQDDWWSWGTTQAGDWIGLWRGDNTADSNLDDLYVSIWDESAGALTTYDLSAAKSSGAAGQDYWQFWRTTQAGDWIGGWYGDNTADGNLDDLYVSIWDGSAGALVTYDLSAGKTGGAAGQDDWWNWTTTQAGDWIGQWVGDNTADSNLDDLYVSIWDEFAGALTTYDLSAGKTGGAAGQDDWWSWGTTQAGDWIGLWRGDNTADSDLDDLYVSIWDESSGALTTYDLSADKTGGAAGQDDWYTWQTTQAGDWIGQWVGDNTADGNLDDLYVSIWDGSAGALVTYDLSAGKTGGAAGQDNWYTWQTTQAGDWIGQWVGDNTADGNLDDLYVSIWDESAGALTTYDLSAAKSSGAAGEDYWWNWTTTQAGDWIGGWVGDNTADSNLDDLYVSIWDASAGGLTTYDLSAGKTGGAAGEDYWWNWTTTQAGDWIGGWVGDNTADGNLDDLYVSIWDESAGALTTYDLSAEKTGGAAGQDDWWSWTTTQAGDWIGGWRGDNTADGNLDDLYVSIWDASAGGLTTYDLSAEKTGGPAGQDLFEAWITTSDGNVVAAWNGWNTATSAYDLYVTTLDVATGTLETVLLGNGTPSSGYFDVVSFQELEDGTVVVTARNTSGDRDAFVAVIDPGFSAQPIVDLNGVAAGVDFAAAFNEGLHQGTGAGAGVAIADLAATVTDPNAGNTIDTIVVTLTNSAGDTGEALFFDGTETGFTVTGSGTDVITITRTTGSNADMEAALQAVRYQNNDDVPTEGNRTIEVTAADNGGNVSDVATTTVTVTAVNDAPATLSLLGSAVDEFAINGTVVGTLSSTDADGPGATYTLTDNAGGRFEIVGNQLRLVNGLLLDFEQSATHDVTVEVSDGAGGTLPQTFQITIGNVDPEDITGTSGADTFFGGALDDTLRGEGGSDDLRGGGGNDTLDGGTGDDTMDGGLGNDSYYVDSLGDMVVGEIGYAAGGGIDTVYASVSYTLGANVEILRLTGTDPIHGTGNSAPNTIVGNDNFNVLRGGGGNDTLNGGANNDALVGGTGQDTLIGGIGADRFDYNAIADSYAGAANRDFINGFSNGYDTIDLSDIDANPFYSGDQAFVFIGSAAFTGSGAGSGGQLRFANYGGNYVIVEADWQGDGVADMQIFVNGTTFMNAGDFVL